MMNKTTWLRMLSVAVLALRQPAAAQVQTLVIGEGGAPWAQTVEQVVGFDTTVAVDGLQPFELDPSMNILVGRLTDSGRFTNIFGGIWRVSTNAPRDVFTDGTPYVYGSRGRQYIVDGDTTLVSDLERLDHYSIDFGFPVPIRRVVFGAPATGIIGGRLVKDAFPRQYMVSGTLSEVEYLLTDPRTTDFDNVIERRLANSQRIADLRFAPQFVRFLRLRFPERGFISEVLVFGEGFAPEARYTSKLFDMGEPVNFGRLHFEFEKYRTTGFGSEAVLSSDAPVRVAVETRTGRDDTPLIFHVITELGTERVVDEKAFIRAPAPTGGGSDAVVFRGAAPGQRGSVQDDIANWSFWTVAQTTTGEEIGAPDGRQFFQVRTLLTSGEIFAFGRLKSIAVEYSPLLAHPVVGEVARMDDPQPQGGVVEVPLGELVTLTYDVRAEFSSASQTGFDAIRLTTPEAVEFQRLEMGDPLVELPPDSLVVTDKALAVYFPSNVVDRGSNTSVRLTFATRVFNFNTLFGGEVFQIDGENLPQSIDSGDASPLVSTNDLRVFVPLDKLEVLSELELGADVLTPNADGINDRLQLSFTLHGVDGAEVDAAIYDLSGRLVHRLASGRRGEGRYTEVWNAQVEGAHVPPGTYLLRVAVDTDLGTFEKMRTIAVAY
ncbi:MAG TPA: gliding motility-associated C-terminal domain-containing protein [Candidatus Latescibacteria bacterium]|nr:hypothetical protein [Gemmatimonadaceae bacterium]HJP30438.1 gliding motility-associated C-terminal domain-containing protein [Candidatus Latescibacterota bacterium]